MSDSRKPDPELLMIRPRDEILDMRELLHALLHDELKEEMIDDEEIRKSLLSVRGTLDWVLQQPEGDYLDRLLQGLKKCFTLRDRDEWN